MNGMSDQSTPGPDPARPEQQPAPAADTAALPAQQPAPAAPVPAPPGWVPASAPAAGGPSGPHRWWNEATSTGGGRAALAAAAVLTALFVVAGIGLMTALLVTHHGGDDRGLVVHGNGRVEQQGPGWGKGNGNGNGNGKNKGQGNGRQQAPGQDDREQPEMPVMPGNPGKGLGRGIAPGAVLHGEFTTDLTGTPTVMVVQTGQVTAYTAGKSLTVESTDGFKATYTLDATTAPTGRTGTTLANGVQVRVVAAKDGMKVTALMVG
jgi:hypothetical protein